MKLLYNLLLLFVSFCVIPSVDAKHPRKKAFKNAKKAEPKSASFLNRTVIASTDLAKKNVWFIDSATEFVASNKQKKEVTLPNHITIKISSGKLLINNKLFKDMLLIINPRSGSFVVQGTNYEGALVVEMKKNVVSLIALEVKDAHKNAIAQYAQKWDEQIQKEIDCEKVAISESKQHKKDPYQFTVRVLLDEEEQNTFESWSFFSKQGFVLMDPTDITTKLHVPEPELNIRIKRDGTILYNNTKLFKDQLYVTPVSGRSLFNDKEYHGSMWVMVDENKTRMLINCVPIENYVASVLCTESWPGWPLEVNKVFAIASRTYVIAMVQNASIAQRPYHVKNTNAHQTYTGGQVQGVQKEAVDQTKGLFLSYNNAPITAMFDACCGGIITAKMSDVNFDHAPYLARNYPCNYCKDCKIYSWQAEFDLYNLEKRLKKELKQLRRLKDVTIAKKDSAGIVKVVNVMSGNRSLKLNGKRLYSLPGVKSFCYTIAKSSHNTITIKGKGYGHHLGLCQWGAKQMVVEGWDYKSVLNFYYPGTKLMRLS